MTDPFNPYASVHENPQGAGDARPTALQIIHDEDLVNKLTDKVMLVTGASSGIGIETTRALHATGANVFMAVRDMKRGQEVKEEILSTGKEKGYEGKLELLEIRLDDLSSVRKAAKEFVERSSGVLNVLVNNAGE
jgi:NAD(P)-dependent dehydrogenase (short-subunit alcohol dehydrogenase family)